MHCVQKSVFTPKPLITEEVRSYLLISFSNSDDSQVCLDINKKHNCQKNADSQDIHNSIYLDT